MGINLGAFLAPLICGVLGEKLGWDYGFAAAGIGMLTAVLIFSLGQRWLQGDMAERPHITARDWLVVLGISWMLLLLAGLGVTFWDNIVTFWKSISDWQRVLLLVTPLAASWLGRRYRRQEVREKLTRTDIHRILAIVILGFFVVVFWMGFEQAGGTMNLFAMEHTDRTFFGWVMPASYFQALNPLMIFLLAPVFSILFVWVDRTRGGFSTPAKMAVGMIILGIGFLVLAVAQEHANVVGRVSPAWLVLVFLFHTIGELFLSPIGLSMVTRLAPVQIASLMMGVWFTAIAVANYLAGTLESMLQGSGIPLYWFLVLSSMGAGVMLLILTPLIKRLMHES
jgi:POT family proton-dependent oligopeptide transporter